MIYAKVLDSIDHSIKTAGENDFFHPTVFNLYPALTGSKTPISRFREKRKR